MERKREIEYNDLLPKKGNPLNEIVTYKVGGTLYEVSTVCGGSELLYDKVKRLIKSETVKTPAYKEKEVRYADCKNTAKGKSFDDKILLRKMRRKAFAGQSVFMGRKLCFQDFSAF